MYANNGDLITSQEIYENSFQHTSEAKFVYLSACFSGQYISQMPYGWLHTTSISSDGYNYPDYSWKCFIGWKDYAPCFWVTVDGRTEAAYHFDKNFYYAALTLGYTVNAALDYTSQLCWQIPFNHPNNKFYHGFSWLGDHFGPLVVYGQGTLYLGNEAYIDQYIDMAAGWVMAQVTDPYNVEGPQNDNHCTGLLAGYTGDYAWVSGSLNREASGYLHLWGRSNKELSQLIIYVSDDYYNWAEVFNDYIPYSAGLVDIDCGHISNPFSYVAICIQNYAYPAEMFIDAVHIHS